VFFFFFKSERYLTNFKEHNLAVGFN